MANEEHLKIVKQGVEVWNQWRSQNPDLNPNLREADLSGMDLKGINFRETSLNQSNLQRANLTKANLWRANLSGADARRANLTDIIMSQADLRWVNFTEAILDGSVFEEALVGWTIFGNIDLSSTKGLDSITHGGPSTIGIDTIYRSKGNISDVFLKGAGAPDNFINYMASLIGKALEFYSCFISYSSKDQEFANRLYADLQRQGVRTWFASEDLKIGERFRKGIDEAIKIHDKLLLILSENSIESGWVEKEVETAFEQERQQKKTVLFPVRVDDAVMETSHTWAADIRRTRHIGDFRNWKKYDVYHKAFNRLLRDLSTEELFS